MAIRQITSSASTTRSRTQKLMRITITGDQRIFAEWLTMRRNGVTMQLSVPVSDALNTEITTRPAFQAVFDQISADTFPRAGADL